MRHLSNTTTGKQICQKLLYTTFAVGKKMAFAAFIFDIMCIIDGKSETMQRKAFKKVLDTQLFFFLSSTLRTSKDPQSIYTSSNQQVTYLRSIFYIPMATANTPSTISLRMLIRVVLVDLIECWSVCPCAEVSKW